MKSKATSSKHERRDEDTKKARKLGLKLKKLDDRIKNLERKECLENKLKDTLDSVYKRKNKNIVAWVALFISIVGTILLPIISPYINHVLYAKDIASFEVEWPIDPINTTEDRVRIPFKITNYGTVPIKIYKKYIYCNSEKKSIKLYDTNDKEMPFKTVYLSGEGLYGFIHLDKPADNNSENISFCIEYFPIGSFSKYLGDREGVCTTIHTVIWKQKT